MRDLNLQITCWTCSNLTEESVNYEFFRQDDDLIVLQCPVCKTQIMYDDVKTESIKILDWLYETNRQLYYQIVKEYFKPLLDI